MLTRLGGSGEPNGNMFRGEGVRKQRLRGSRSVAQAERKWRKQVRWRSWKETETENQEGWDEAVKRGGSRSGGEAERKQVSW
jgi:hypothetical protein